MSSTSQHVIQEGNRVLLKKADNLRLFQVQRNREIWLDKTRFALDGLIGHPYGTRFEVKDGQMVKITKPVPQNLDSTEKGIVEGKDNRNLHDLDSNQKLTADEIDQMKKEGASGEKVIEQLIENSATFQNKTEYAQEKWVKKKKKKHMLEFTVLKPTSRLLCELYWSKGPSKICNLRIDTLGQMLTWGNVRANSTVAVVDSCMGLVTGAVMERLGGFGKVISFYHGGNPVKSPLDAYDFTQEVRDTLIHFPMEQLNAVHRAKITGTEPAQNTGNGCQGNGVPAEKLPKLAKEAMDIDNKSDAQCSEGNPDTEAKSNAEIDTGTEATSNADIDPNAEAKSKTDATPEAGAKSNADIYPDTEGNSNAEIDPDTEAKSKADTNPDTEAKSTTDVTEDTVKPEDSPAEEDRETDTGSYKKSRRGKGSKRKSFKDREAAREDRSKETEKARSILLQGNIDCLIVASKFHAAPILTTLVDFMAPSRQVIVFSQFKEALEDCYVFLREHGALVSYRLTETWLRNYQVLPNRTHPVIQMSGTGGYLLTATTVSKQSTRSDNI